MSVVDSQTFKPKIRAVARKSTSKPPRVWINGKSSPNTTDGGKMETSSPVVSSSDRPVSMDTVGQPEVLDRNVSTDTIRNHDVFDRNGDSWLQEPNLLDEKVEMDSGITGRTGLDNSDTVSCDTDELLDNGVESGKDDEMESIEEINSTQLSTDNSENILTISDSDTSMDTNNPAAKVTEEKTLSSSPVAMGVKVRNSVRDIMSKIVQVAGPEVNKILSRPKNEDTERDGGPVSIKPSTEAKLESKTISGKPLKENLFEIMSAESEQKQLVDSHKISQRIDSEVLNKNRTEKQELFYDQSRATTLADSNSPDTTAHRSDLHPVTLRSQKPFTTNASSDNENKSCSVPIFDTNLNNNCQSFEASFDNNSNNNSENFEASFRSNSNKDCKSFEISSVESSNNNCKSLGNNGKFSGNNSKSSVASLDNDSNEDISEIVSNLDDNSQSRYSNISDIDDENSSREVSEMEVDNDGFENSENLWESVISVESTLKSKSHMVEAPGKKSKIRQNISSVEDRDANPSIAKSKKEMTHLTSSLDNCDTTSECTSVSKSSLVNQDSKSSVVTKGDELKKEEKMMTGGNVGTDTKIIPKTEDDQKQDVKCESKLVLKSEVKKEMTDEECLVKCEDSKKNSFKTEVKCATRTYADKIPKTENRDSSLKVETKDVKTESSVKAEKVPVKTENSDSEVKSENVENEVEKVGATNENVREKIVGAPKTVTENIGVTPKSSKDLKQSKDPLTEKIGVEPESSKDRIQSKETVTESLIDKKQSIETMTESPNDEKQSMGTVKHEKQSMETVMEEKQTKEMVTESRTDKKLETVTEPLKDKKRLMELSDSESPAPLKRSRLDIMIGKLGDQIGIPPDTVPDPIDCDDDSESEGEEESEEEEEEEEEDGVKTEEDTEDGVGAKTMEDGVKIMEDEEDGVGAKTMEDEEDAKNRFGVKTAENDSKNRFTADEKKNSSKAKDGDRDETKNSHVEKETKVSEESKNPGNQGQKSQDGVTTTSEKEEVVLLKIDTVKEKGDKGKVKSPEVSMVIDDDDDVTVIEPVPEKQPDRNREIYYDKNTDLEKIIRERVLQMFKTYRNEKIEDLERRIAALNEMNDKWKATAKELQKQVVDLTVVQHRLDKRKAATAALKMINSRTIGCQVDTTKIQSTDTAGQMVTKSPQKPTMLSQNQFTFSSVPIQTVTTPNMVSMIKRPNMVPVNNVSQLLSATAVSRTSLSTPSSSSARLPLHTSVRNLLETSGKNAKTTPASHVTPGPAASQLLKQVSRGIGGSTPGAKVIDLTADEDQNKKMASSKGSSTQVTMVPMSALPPTNLGQTILRPLTSGSTIPPGASILLSGPTGTQFVNQTSLNRMAATGNLQVMQVSGASGSGIRPGSLLTVVPSSTTGGASTAVYPQSLTFSSPSTNKPIVVDTGKFRPSAPPLQTSVVSLSTPVPQKNIITPPILKHPAALPAQPVNKTPAGVVKGIVPPKPDLKISRVSQGIVLSWTITQNLSLYSEISSYQLFAYQEGSSPPSSTLWKKVGDVKALPLPMACTLTQFQEGNKYHFAVRAVDVYTRVSEFSEPSSIHLFPKSS